MIEKYLPAKSYTDSLHSHTSNKRKQGGLRCGAVVNSKGCVRQLDYRFWSVLRIKRSEKSCGVQNVEQLRLPPVTSLLRGRPRNFLCTDTWIK
jgi:hypothetical protein